jgi:hypothetical protein
MKVRRLGTCYVCRQPLFGYREPVVLSPSTDTSNRKGVSRDTNGLRHGKCRAPGPGFGSTSGVSVSDA